MEQKKSPSVWPGIVLAVLAAASYAVFYGKPNGSMDNMSWPAFWLLIGGAAFALLTTFIKKPKLGAFVLPVCALVAFLLSVYKFYPYISAAIVGIDSTWEASFFVVIGLMVLTLIVGCVVAMKSLSFKGALPKILLPAFAFLFGVTQVGGVIANENAPQISGFLKTPTSMEVHTGDPNEDTEYFKSAYTSLADLMAAGRAKAEEAMAEGIVLLRNENNALPLAEGERKISFFGMSVIDPVYGGTGSGNVDTSSAPTWKTAFERNNLFSVNEDLWNWYAAPEQEAYKRTTGQTGPGVTGAKSIGEAPWDVIKSANGSTFVQYGDAAIVVISRLGGEGSDMPRGTLALSKLDDVDGSLGDTVGGDYLKLSPKEQALLSGLKAEKDAGTIKKIVVLLNFANQVEADFIDNANYGIDAALWIGTPGQVGMYAVADVLAGNVNPSGHLSATFWRTHDQNPALANFGTTAYAGAPDAVNADGSPQQDKYYVVYQEGIYVGYRYTESRYEDVVMGTPGAGAYDYAKTVSFPFGFGLSYTDFVWSDYAVEKSGSGANTVYTVSVKVTNNGSAAGKETVQIYLQKPYGEYNKENGVEAASAELVGFAKTKLLAPGESETVKVVVAERQFASYDSNNAKTYVITEGDYYLTAAKNAHDAVNNFLAKKGYTPESTNGRMDAEGNAALASDAITLGFDKETYKTSEATGYEITNRFDYADWNKYEHRGEDTVTYMSRSDWEGTTPASWADTTILHWNEYITADQDKYGRQSETKLPTTDAAYPNYDTYKDGETLSLIDLRVDADGNEIPYDDPKWDQLLDQLTWEDYTSVIPSGMRRNGQIASINKMECLDHNGPSGLTQPYSTSARGLATKTDDPDKKAKAMCYPAGGILAATFNTDLMYEVGDLIGEDALWAGYNGLYGPGSNIQRTPYSGRNFEYYSEDGYLSGMICAYECAAMESHGLYVYNKHIGLNDQEDLRRGICTWANEQSIREIYMRAFELPITIAGKSYEKDGETLTLKGASGVMLAFNRMGLHWSGMQRDMVTEFLRNECGMTGIVVTDMWYGTASPYMNLPMLLVSGGNLVDGMMKAEDLDASRPGTGHADVAWGMREAMHRILYTVVHSNAMNGVSAGTTIVAVTPWWQTAVKAAQIGFGVLTALALLWVVIKSLKKKEA
ncbi:MAG: glycoside hydrolase family 3 protein [Lachnospiraceae bacterium]|nr:glycoside hydrolase family 3 protein [Lachnospiraceae bacterium]